MEPHAEAKVPSSRSFGMEATRTAGPAQRLGVALLAPLSHKSSTFLVPRNDPSSHIVSSANNRATQHVKTVGKIEYMPKDPSGGQDV